MLWNLTTLYINLWKFTMEFYYIVHSFVNCYYSSNHFTFFWENLYFELIMPLKSICYNDASMISFYMRITFIQKV